MASRARKPLIFLGYTLSSLARPLLTFASTFPFIATLRIIDGAGKGTKDAPRDALIADSSAGDIRGKAFGFHRFIDTAGSVIGPLIASSILLFVASSITGYRLIFILSAIPGLAALVLIFFGVREPKHVDVKRVSTKKHFPVAFWIFLAGSTLAMLTRANDALVLVRASDAGIPTQWIPALFAMFTLIYAVLSYPIGIWSDRISRLPLLVGGWFILAIAEVLFALEGSAMSVIMIIALYGLFYALTEGSGRAFIADIVPQESRGTAYALFHAITGVALIAGGYGVGKIWDLFSFRVAFSLSAIGSLCGAIILSILLIRRNKINELAS